MVKFYLKRHKNYIFLYIFSCFALFLCSYFSPLYEYNFSPDPSIYLTIGRGIINGLVPYKDLLDIKGPIIFFLYAIFSPFKLGTNYFGIFILETIALWVSITFIYKTILLISKSQNCAFILTLVYPFILLNQDSFVSGGEAEEFILPFIFLLIYYVFVIIQNNLKATKFQYLVLGFSVGYVFWIKYTCLGAWIAFYLWSFINFLIHKNFKELKKLFFYSLIGFLIPTSILLGYFIINHGFSDLLWGYFEWNYIYGGSTHEGLFKQISFIFFHSFTIFFKRNPIIWLLVIAGPYLSILSSKIVKKNSEKILLISMTFSSIGLEFIGGTMYQYYQQMSIPFVVITFCWIALKIKNIKIDKINTFVLPIFISLLTLIGIIIVNPNIQKSNLVGYKPYQKRFARTINRNKKFVNSILDFNELDQGWYNYLNCTPPTKYFNKMNEHHSKSYDSLINAQLNIIKKKQVTYVICSISNSDKKNKIYEILLKNYKIIDQQKVKGFNTVTVLLLKVKQ